MDDQGQAFRGAGRRPSWASLMTGPRPSGALAIQQVVDFLVGRLRKIAVPEAARIERLGRPGRQMTSSASDRNSSQVSGAPITATTIRSGPPLRRAATAARIVEPVARPSSTRMTAWLRDGGGGGWGGSWGGGGSEKGGGGGGRGGREGGGEGGGGEEGGRGGRGEGGGRGGGGEGGRASGRRRRTPPHETILRFGLRPALGRLQPPVEGREAAAAEDLERKGDGAEGADQQERPPDGLTPVFGKATRQEEAETRTKGLASRQSGRAPAESLGFSMIEPPRKEICSRDADRSQRQPTAQTTSQRGCHITRRSSG